MTHTTLLIARHGNTFAAGEVVRRVGGRTDLPLVASGVAQAKALGRYLRDKNLQPAVMYISELQRTRQTAIEALHTAGWQLPLIALPQFNEIDYGMDENQPETEVLARLGAATLQAWETDSVVPEGWRVNPAAIISAWQNFATDIVRDYAGQIVLVVTSNGIARFAPHLTGDIATFRAAHHGKLATGALGIMQHEAEQGWQVQQWNVKP